MKILLSISMSLLFLFQGMSANMGICEQIEKISCFVSHYQEHKEFDNYSFLEYVYEDYINDEGNSDDHHQDSEHDNAPVHSSHQCCQHFVFLDTFQTFLINSIPNEAKSQYNLYTFELNSRYLESLFQPPRV